MSEGRLALAGWVGGVFGRFGSLPLLAKIVIILVAVTAVVVVLARLRDSAANNLRKARTLHEEAVELHETGEEEEAKALFEKSNYLREKAFEQLKGS